jgi:alkylation response protein AidB-like acyl-CoA dehydrogenase
MASEVSLYTTEDEAFRAEVRAFIAAHIPPDVAQRNQRGYHPTKDDVVLWTRALHARGWSVPNWPVEYGGPGWSVRQRHIFEEESFRMGAPEISPQGHTLVGPVIYAFASPEMKDRFLPKIRSGEHTWAQGFSEPNAGSDLASLRTRALRDGDHYVVNGQKIWTSEAHCAEWLFLLVRTNTEGKPQAGISFLLVDLKTPGITVRPIIAIDEAHTLNEVFLEDVRVPVENLVGQENMGWTYAKHLLEAERSFSANVPRCKVGLERLKSIAATVKLRGKPLIGDPAFAARIAQLEIDFLAHETTVWRVVVEEENGRSSAVPTSSILKVRGGELLQQVEQLMVEALGDHAIPVYPEHDYLGEMPNDAPGPDFAPGVVSEFMYRRAITIYGGSNEVQRNIIAGMLLRA